METDSSNKKDCCLGSEASSAIQTQLMIPANYYSAIHVCSYMRQEYIIRGTFASENEFLEFFQAWSAESNITWRTQRTYPSGMSAGVKNIFWRQYRCQSSSIRLDKNVKHPSLKHTDCTAEVTVTIKRVIQRCRSKDPHMPAYPTLIKAQLNHNHGTLCADNLKHKDVLDETKKKFKQLFHAGYSPKLALYKHKCELQAKHKDNYFIVSVDRGICPDLPWCYRLYDKVKNTRYKVLINFEEQLKGRFNDDCVQTVNLHGQTIVAICTPLMKNVHHLWPFSGELMFIDSSGNFDGQQHRVFVLSTHSYAGGLPMGVFITTSESEESIAAGLEALVGLLGDKAFYGKGSVGPDIIISNDLTVERNALSKVFPFSTLLLCTLHILQAAWKYIWKSDNHVKLIDRPQLFNYIKRIMYSQSEVDLEKRFQQAINSPLFISNPNLLQYLKTLWEGRHLWALVYRHNLCFRGNNTNNYVESAMRILKDKIFHGQKSYNILHLIEYIFEGMENYYVKKLTDLAINKIDCCIQQNYNHNNDDLFVSDTNSDDIYHVTNIGKGIVYEVDINIGLCSCYVGFNGAPCKHQSEVVKKLKLSSCNFLPLNDENQRILMHKIALGENSSIPPDFYAPLKHNDYMDIKNTPCSSPNIPVSPELPKIDVPPENNKENLILELEAFYSHVKQKLATATGYESAVASFTRSFRKCKTDSALLHAMHNFGKPIRNKSRKIINMQPTSKSRRVSRLGGNAPLQCGRPSKKHYTEHNYAKKNKRKHASCALSECVG